MLKRMRDNKGFTLMEIIIVIVILGILALLAIPRLLGFTDQAEIASDKEYAAVVARAGELYWASHDKALPAATGTIATVDDDVETLLNSKLIDSPVDVIQYDHAGAAFDSIGIDIDANGVATVIITYDTDVTITFNTSAGYTLAGL